ncbi:MAG TPA: polysaccharide biosynthesis tyrosine autokinase [Acetobacteraceae bacterium]|nr:polysaccharide biosynthesis tyrosine autokinase [Acetobacteraceae bacterium]
MGAGNSAPRPPSQAGGIDFKLLLGTLRRRAALIVLLGLIGAGLGYALQTTMKPRYTSAVSVLLDPKGTNSFGAEAQFGGVFVDRTKIESVVSVIESSGLLGRVVLAEHLANDPEFGAPADSRLQKWLGFLPFMHGPPEPDDLATRQQRALVRLTRALRVERFGMTYVLTISVSASHPETARRLAEAVADAYLSDQVDAKADATQRDSAWLTNRLDQLRGELVRDEKAVAGIRQKYGLLQTDEPSGATIGKQTLTVLNTQLEQAKTDVAARHAEVEQIDRIRSTGGSLESLPEVAASRVVEGLRANQAALAQQLATLRFNYHDDFPAVRKARDDERALQSQIAAEIARIVRGIRNEYQLAIAREQALTEQLKQAETTEAGKTSVDGNVLLRDAQRVLDANRGLYDALLARWRDVQQQMGHEEPEARIISRAALPDKPSWPKPLLLPAAGSALLMLAAVAMTLVPVLLDRRVVNVAGLEQRVGLPVLAAIPLLRRRDLAFARRRLSVIDYATRNPLSRFAESLRVLRAYLGISTGAGPRIVQVTSSVPGEGKSTMAAALAVSSAAAGLRTILVDADVRFSTISKMFGIRRDEGLTDVLGQGSPWRSVVRNHGDLPLAILSAGSAMLPEPDVISSAHFAGLLNELSKNFDLVILDSPPVLAVSDPLVLSRYADATLLVVQWRATARDLVDQTVKALRMVDAPLVGMLLNKIDLTKAGQYDYGYTLSAGANGYHRA